MAELAASGTARSWLEFCGSVWREIMDRRMAASHRSGGPQCWKISNYAPRSRDAVGELETYCTGPRGPAPSVSLDLQLFNSGWFLCLGMQKQEAGVWYLPLTHSTLLLRVALPELELGTSARTIDQ